MSCLRMTNVRHEFVLNTVLNSGKVSLQKETVRVCSKIDEWEELEEG